MYTAQFRMTHALMALLLLLCVTVAAEDFGNLTIADFGKLVSEKTGYTVLYAPRVKVQQKITIFSGKKEFSDHEFYQLFLTVLRLHGYTATLHDNILRVVRSRRARSQPVPVILN